MTEQGSEDLGKEIAKANQEKWKAIQKGIDLTDRAADFLGVLFGSAPENIGGILSDQTKHWRAQNINRIASLWEERIRERGIHDEALKHLPFGDAYKLIETASTEDDEDVQAMWADLIANATDPKKSTKIKKVYIDLLQSFSSPEVIFLNLLMAAESKTHFGTKEQIDAHDQEINALANSAWRKLDKGTRDTALQNLVRLRCLAFRPPSAFVKNLFQVPRDINQSWPRGFALVNVEEFQKLIIYIEDIVLTASGVIDHKPAAKIPLQGGSMNFSNFSLNIPEMNYILTPMAKDLLGACQDVGEKNERKVVA
ncbi:Abi-alpha family protein [Micavibrio aeruginosavorus]|uniref:DUF4393 domain-containing protein n=1 Tax=Micavibrio aeruginosavorus EPB TaxID=349215 RepID=M4VEN4_9BACT|nr:Abi-alpha family protein [Micavibrio aeruginosavorus]AGH97693.1 hypothetical protein A11S_870 [Micavibrio aeruginosavorus EPB]